MRLFVINTGYDMSDEEIEIRVQRMKRAASPDTTIHMECLEETKICIDSQLDVALASPEIIKKAIKAEKEGYDAVLLYCTSDPAMEACREAVKIPVIGGGMASFLTAAAVGSRYSMIITSKERESEKYRFIKASGLNPGDFISVQSIEYDILSMQKQKEKTDTVNQLAAAAKKCVADGADVVILGCLGFAGMGEDVSHEVGVPVIDPAFAMVGLAEALCRQKLAQSRHAYCNPPKRARIWAGGSME